MSDKDKRRKILDAALELIREKGLEGTRIIDIANRAGIGKGTVYDYFTSKEDIIAATAEDVVERDFRNIFGEVDRARDFETKLRLFIQAHLDILETYGAFIFLFAEKMVTADAEHSDEIPAALIELRDEHVRKLMEIVSFGIETRSLKEGLDAVRATTFIISVVIGFAIYYMKGSCGTDRKAMQTDQIMELILQGIRKEDGRE
ncbi:MAG: TetR/AcrR family transcriptional regulator [Firmicutes bacterium]|jgi:TetR/AcrR family fatty acid metabolism transcriptional regulator|nr:TetR/AcrR family transcriptional regulator [Bacillota bacterium]